jgi:hypothetical protein
MSSTGQAVTKTLEPPEKFEKRQSSTDPIITDTAIEPESKKLSAPPAYLQECLEDAERLLRYASEMGIEVADDLRNNVLHARAEATLAAGWDQEIASKLLATLSMLAAKMKPVTAESLKASVNTHSTIRTYWTVAVCLAVFIVPFSRMILR